MNAEAGVKLVPIPLAIIEQTQPDWLPYLLKVAERSGDDVNAMAAMLYRGEVQPVFVWDAEKKSTKAFIGVQFIKHGERLTGRIIWLVGEDRKTWVHLFGELEAYLRDHQGCVRLEAIARPGWKPHLETNGFKLTHLHFAKELTP